MAERVVYAVVDEDNPNPADPAFLICEFRADGGLNFQYLNRKTATWTTDNPGLAGYWYGEPGRRGPLSDKEADAIIDRWT